MLSHTRLPGDKLRHAPLHFVGRLVRKRQRQNLRRRHAAFDQIRDPVRDDPRLAAPRPGQHQQRPVAMRHRLALRLRQVIQADRSIAICQSRRQLRCDCDLWDGRSEADSYRGFCFRISVGDTSRRATRYTHPSFRIRVRTYIPAPEVRRRYAAWPCVGPHTVLALATILSNFLRKSFALGRKLGILRPMSGDPAHRSPLSHTNNHSEGREPA